MQVPVKCMNIDQEPVLGCLATDSVSDEFSLDLSPFANNSCRDAWTSAVRACEVCSCTISCASCCNQASRASAHTYIASLVIFTPGCLSCRTLCKYESQPWLLLPKTFLRLLPSFVTNCDRRLPERPAVCKTEARAGGNFHFVHPSCTTRNMQRAQRT